MTEEVKALREGLKDILYLGNIGTDMRIAREALAKADLMATGDGDFSKWIKTSNQEFPRDGQDVLVWGKGEYSIVTFWKGKPFPYSHWQPLSDAPT